MTTSQLATTEPQALSPALTTKKIIQYICPNATEKEAYVFLRLCQAQGLNPFLREAYLIKYKPDANPTMMVGASWIASCSDATRLSMPRCTSGWVGE